MGKFKIASHDTMSYLKPLNWYYKPFHFVAKCQSKTIQQQYNDYGIRLFDLRIKWYDKGNCWKFAHGSMFFDGDVDEVISWLNEQGDCMVRLILEYNKAPKNETEIKNKFTETVEEYIKKYDKIVFFEFTAKWSWERLYQPTVFPDMWQGTSSMTWKIWDDWYPYLYAKTFNKENINQGTSHEYMLLDFVEIQ